MAFADDGPAKDVPELSALAHYVGTWHVAITSKDSPFAKGESSAEWILDGRFVQQIGTLMSADGNAVAKITTLMTFDKKEGRYRMWSFISDGATFESAGKWDEKKRTMTSTRRDGGMTTTTTATFLDGREEWTIVTTNQSNDVVGNLKGTNTIRKQ